jgi:hypothetical protein
MVNANGRRPQAVGVNANVNNPQYGVNDEASCPTEWTLQILDRPGMDNALAKPDLTLKYSMVTNMLSSNENKQGVPLVLGPDDLDDFKNPRLTTSSNGPAQPDPRVAVEARAEGKSYTLWIPEAKLIPALKELYSRTPTEGVEGGGGGVRKRKAKNTPRYVRTLAKHTDRNGVSRTVYKRGGHRYVKRMCPTTRKYRYSII